VRVNSGAFEFRIKYKTATAFDRVFFQVWAGGWASPDAATPDSSTEVSITLPATSGVWTDLILVVDVTGSDASQYWNFGMYFGKPGEVGESQSADFDSVFVYPIPAGFGSNVIDGKVISAAVPQSDTTADAGKFLKSDGTWQNAGAGVSELVDLSDVNTSIPTVRNILIADGVDWESRQAVAADIQFTTQQRFLGRTTIGAGDGEELTGAQANVFLPLFSSVLKGLAPLSGGGSTNYLRADGTWAAPPGGAHPVASVFGRTGAVVAAQADYDSFFLTPAEGNAAYSLLGHAHAAADITSGIFAVARIPNLNASKITAGTFVDARIPNLNASKITAGIFAVARIPNLSASKITTGTLVVLRGGTGVTTSTGSGATVRGTSPTFVTDIRFNDANTKLLEGPGNSVRIQTNFGNVNIGPQNTSWCHFSTDRVAFHFGQAVHFAGTAMKYTKGHFAYWSSPSTGASAQMTVSTLAASGGNNGDIHFRY